MDVSYFLEYGVAVGDKNPRIKGANTCFNCGSAYHSIQACPVVKNEDVIRAQARKFRSSATDSSESNKRIHTIVAERKEYLEKLKRHKPGEFSEELRNAMTMDRVSGNFEFVKNMYIHGYPASYISSDKNMNLDRVFDKAMGNETGSEGEEYDDDNDDELVIYTDSGHVLEDVENKKPKRFAKKDVSTTSPSKTQFPTKYYPLAAYPGLNFDDFIFDEPASNDFTLPATKGNLGKPKIITRRTEQAQIWEPVGRLTTQNNFNSSINNVPFTNFANVHLPNSGFNTANARGMPVPGLNSNTAPLYPTTNFTEYQYTYPPSSTLSTTTLPTPNYINPANTGAINQHSGIPGLSSYKYVPANKQTTSNANNHATFKNKTSPKDKSDPVSSALTLDRDDQSVEEGEIVDDENINTDSDMELGD
ncbi:Zinc finger CCHC domain-containing protein 8 [Zancudomyces culisetae]|uniref:Zinc finger CCHC domain-containing protein 8 n=1 Tax=Zancudomyces culisetae TaxID=1213189 RepID=A0A1R1PWF6_ZANCU|nr:Zinc finger CCHC domain-containing protein 8 [Zancudomyces culisetae]|eukprot:OMH85291.1 Zinc finger CCHC domain-containing protein 8 [Zancudomyces culisetae]